MRRVAVVAAVLASGVLALATPAAHAGLAGDKITAEGDAFALRVEYDIPLPAGTGTIPHVVGEARRSIAGENSKGAAAAPSEMDLVVGGTFAKPHDKAQTLPEPYPMEQRLPQTECFYPGHLVDTVTKYPTDARAETAALPPISVASATCGAGPVTELRASSASVGQPDTPSASLGAVVRAGATSAYARFRPVEDRLEAVARAGAADVSILGGVVQIGSVAAEGSSVTQGLLGTASSFAQVTVNDIVAGGQRFTVTTDQLVAGGRTMPLGSDQARAFLDAVNAVLAPQGCTLTVLTSPSRYPQGFIFARKPPRLGIEHDGTFAGSMRGGLLVECDIPGSVSDQTNFSPQRVQILAGFTFTAVSALEEPAGFGVGSLLAGLPASFTPTPLVSGVAHAAPDQGALAGAVLPAVPSPVVTGPAPSTQGSLTHTIGTWHRLAPATRRLLVVLGLVVWAALTHVGITRLRRALS